MDESKLNHIRTLIESLNEVEYIMPEDIPNIDLYMDQLTTFMDEHLKSSKRYQDDKLLTKTMINNYTKNKLLPPPKKKKYSKEHMFLLIYIYYFKNILSISDIQRIFTPLTQKFYGPNSDYKLEDIYKEVVLLQEEQTNNLAKDMIRKMNRAEEAFKDVEDFNDKEFLSLFTFVCTLCFDVYIRKHMVEKIIDIFAKGSNSDKDKKDKDKVAK